MVGQKRPKMVRYSKLVMCNDFDTLAAWDLRVLPPWHIFYATTRAQLLRKRFVIYNS